METRPRSCPCCGPLAARMEEAGAPLRPYGRLLRELMEAERQGRMELFAGDCPLRDAGAVLDAEEHYTVCHYMRCRRCGALYFAGACVWGEPVFRRVEDLRKEALTTRLWGRCGTFYRQEKG